MVFSATFATVVTSAHLEIIHQPSEASQTPSPPTSTLSSLETLLALSSQDVLVLFRILTLGFAILNLQSFSR